MDMSQLMVFANFAQSIMFSLANRKQLFTYANLGFGKMVIVAPHVDSSVKLAPVQRIVLIVKMDIWYR